MRISFFFSFLFITAISYAESDKRPDRPSYQIIKSQLDKKLRKNQSAFTFLLNPVVQPGDEIIYADNDNQETIKVSRDLQFEIKTTPGKHKFAFYFNSEYHEIFTDSIEVKPQFRTTVQLYFNSATQNQYVRKPVIYLYPENEQDIIVEIQPKGELIFTYPNYNDGWKVSATPDGTITHEDEELNYLFWESEQEQLEKLVDPTAGFFVKTEDLTSFFENTLTTFGLTPKEQQDFITYWVPIMKDNPFLYIYFLFNEECDAFGKLNISPKPDNTGRIYMLWSDSVPSEKGQLPIPQDIPSVNREGFTVIEWGGANFVH